MVSIEFLKTKLGFANPDQQVFTANGYDGVIAILNQLRGVEFPCVILEDKDSGYFSVDGSSLDIYQQTIWIMDKADRNMEKVEYSEAFASTFSLMKSLIKKLVKYQPELTGLDTSRMSYYKRFGGPNCCGYELNIQFNEDIELYEQ